MLTPLSLWKKVSGVSLRWLTVWFWMLKVQEIKMYWALCGILSCASLIFFLILSFMLSKPGKWKTPNIKSLSDHSGSPDLVFGAWKSRESSNLMSCDDQILISIWRSLSQAESLCPSGFCQPWSTVVTANSRNWINWRVCRSEQWWGSLGTTSCWIIRVSPLRWVWEIKSPNEIRGREILQRSRG